MTAMITPADRERIAGWLTVAQERLADVDAIEQHIARVLGVADDDGVRSEPAFEAISDTVAGVVTLDGLLRQLDIAVDGADGDA